MKIAKSRTTKVQPHANWPARLSIPLKVEVDWTAAGQSATSVYLCAVDEAGSVWLQRLDH
jgi:hypothetical protein